MSEVDGQPTTLEPPSPGSLRGAELRFSLLFRILPVLPALLALGLILHFGVNVPVFDQWMPDIAGMFIKAHQGQLSIGDFFVQHNEHRIAVPKLIFFVLGSLSHWNTMWETVFEWIVLCGTAAGISWLGVRTSNSVPALRGTMLVRVFLCSLLIFIPQQWENWLGGMGLCNVLPMFFAVAGIVIATTSLPIWIRTILAMAPATLAMYSLGNGFLAWPLIGLLLIWSDSWEQLKGKIWPLAAWCGVFVLLSALYMIGYHSSAKTDEERAAYFAGFIPILHYVLNLLGNYFAYVGRYPSHVTSTTLSTIMLAMYLGAVGYFIWICRRGRGEVCRWMMVWLVVGGFAVLSALMAGLIRAGLGIGQAESSRYVAFSIYLPVALVNLIPLLIADARLHATRLAAAIFPPATNAVLAALLLFLYLLSIQVSVHDMGIVHKTLIIARVDLQLLKLFPDHPLLLKCLTFDPKQTLVMAQELNQIGYINPPLILSDDASRILEVTTAPPGSLGNIKNIDQQGEEIRAYGYATQPFASSPADAVFVTYDNAAGRPIILALAEMAVLFPGQADDGSDPELVATQWGVVFPTSRLPPDLKHIRIRAWQLDGRTGKAFEMNGANAATGMSRN